MQSQPAVRPRRTSKVPSSRFMIVASFGRLEAISGHDHEVPDGGNSPGWSHQHRQHRQPAGWRVNAEDPAYVEEMGNYRAPDPPRKPFPPRYRATGSIRNHPRISFPVSAVPQAMIAIAVDPSPR